MGDSKNHHQLPRMYLRGFCHKVLHERENYRQEPSRCAVWVYDSETPEGWEPYRRRGVKNLSTESYYYSFDTPDGPDSAPEKALSKLEGKAATIIRHLEPGYALEPAERARLAIFAASMKFRVASYRESADERARSNAPRIKRDAFPDIETLAQGLRKAGHEEAEDAETVRRIFEEVHSEDYEFTLTKNHYIEHMFELTQKAAVTLLEREWVLAWAPNKGSFVTSDDPLVLAHRLYGAPHGFTDSVGFASPEACILFPLTQDVCLMAKTGEPRVRHVRFDRQEVRQMNLAQATHYRRWLIGRDRALVKNLIRARC